VLRTFTALRLLGGRPECIAGGPARGEDRAPTDRERARLGAKGAHTPILDDPSDSRAAPDLAALRWATAEDRAPRGVARAARPARTPRLSVPGRYAASLALTGACFLVQYLLLPEPSIAPFVFFYLAVAVTAWVGGRPPAFLAVVTSALVANYFFIPPYRAWATSEAALTATGLFLASASAVALLCASFRTASLLAERAGEALQEVDRRKDQFLAVLSHELRNPLAPIQNAIQVMERAPPGGEQSERARQVVARQAAHLTRLVDDLLDVTRIARGKIRLRREPLALGDLVLRTAGDHEGQFASRNVSLEVRRAAEPLWVDGDATRLAQVVGNLLHNAVKFARPGGWVQVSVEREGEEAVLRVADDGVGIEPQVLPHLFEPFRQADESLHRAPGGLGLGLALVKGLVEMHGGRVSARSEGPSRGAEFTVALPIRPEPSAPAPVPAVAEPQRRPRRVLIIDDNRDAAETLQELLELDGQLAAVAFDGPTGIAQALALPAELVFCDIGLPGIDGYEVARRLRVELPSATLVAVTGYALPADLQRAALAGFDHHLRKPVDLDRLRAMVAGAIAPPPRG